VESLLRDRSSRELAALVALALLVLVSVIPAMLQATGGEEAVESLLEVGAVPAPVRWGASLLPPGLAAASLEALHAGRTLSGLVDLAGILAWGVLGGLLGLPLFTRVMLEAPSGSAPRSRRRRALATGPGVLTRVVDRVLPADVAAVAGKELRYVLRSASGRFSLVGFPLFVALALLVFRSGIERPFFGFAPEQTVFYGVLMYAAIFVPSYLVNSFAWEGTGMAGYFLGPTTGQRVLVGKNLGVAAFNGLLILELLAVWVALADLPGGLDLINGVLAFAFWMLILAAAGNHTSVLFPVARSITSMTNSPSQTATVVSLAVLFVGGLLAGAALVVPVLTGHPGAQPLVLAVLDLCAGGLYLLALPAAARLLDDRREALMDAVSVRT
jgi:hypothetical protein